MGFRLTIQGLRFRVSGACVRGCARIRAFHLVGLRFALQAIVGQGNTACRH